MTTTLAVRPLGPSPVELAGVAVAVARHPPFRDYPFATMLGALRLQLQHGANVALIESGRIVGYAGWVRAREEVARRWTEGQGDLLADWQQGDAVVVTVLVAERRALVARLVREISTRNAGQLVFRRRSFQDGRTAMMRPPIRAHRTPIADPCDEE